MLEDADIEQAARGICYGIFSSAGQACIAGSRLFIHESIYAPLMARLLELTRGLRVGHPFTDGVHVGPLINEKHRQSVIQYVLDHALAMFFVDQRSYMDAVGKRMSDAQPAC